MEDGEDVREHVQKFFDAIDKLAEMDVDINADLQAIMLLYSLPPSFENFRCAIESRDDLPSPETLRVKVIEKSDARKNNIRGMTHNAMFANKRRNQKKGKSGNNENSASKPEFKYRCHRCREVGHKGTDCKKKRQYVQPTARNAENVVLCAVERFTEAHGYEALRAEYDIPDRKWCLDSGATSHLCSEKREFAEMDESKRGKLNLASSDSMEIAAKGTVSFTAEVDGKVKNVSLTNMLYVPDLRANLLSVAKMTNKGCEVLFTKHRAIVTGSDGSVKLTADRSGDVFYVRETKREECRKISNTACDEQKPSKKI